MNRILNLFIIVIFIVGCYILICYKNERGSQINELEKKYYIYPTEINHRSIYTYNIDGCEYIGEIGGDGKNDILTHKGNCKNPIHKK